MKAVAVVKADLEACQGYANCVVGADDYFDIDDDGVVVLLKTEVPEGEESIRWCVVVIARPPLPASLRPPPAMRRHRRDVPDS